MHDPQVGGHALADVGALQLDHRLAAVGQHAGVHLADRRRRERRLLEVLEDLRRAPGRGPCGSSRARWRRRRAAPRRGSAARRSTAAPGRCPGDDAMSWPSFTNVGPSASNASMAPSEATVAHEPLRWRVSFCASARTQAHGDGEVDHHHPLQLGVAELVDRRRVDVERPRRRSVGERARGSATPCPARRSRWRGAWRRSRSGCCRAPSRCPFWTSAAIPAGSSTRPGP